MRLAEARQRATERLEPARLLAGGADLQSAVRAAVAISGQIPPSVTAAEPGRSTLVALQEAVSDAAAVAGPGAGQAELAAALLQLSGVVDAALPHLGSGGNTMAPAASVVGCDVSDQAPALCIAGQGSNVITGDYALVVDLGGDDVHRHAAGGADPQGNGLPVSVTIDVAGNDRYETPVPSASGSRAVHGGGFEGGIGVLVDAAGQDVYRAASSAVGAQALGQGFGSAGAGLLADLGGNDDFALEERTSGVVSSTTQRLPAAGQGFGELGGIGIALDNGGDDVAVVRSSPPAEPTPAVRHAAGFGAGEQGGVGLHVDAGGRDAFTVEALNGTSPASYGTSARGFGWGFEGAGADIGGSGDTVRIARARNDITGEAADSAALFAIGTSSLGGFGALHDAGGADRYVADFATISTSEETVDDGCGCQGATAAAEAGGGQTLAIGVGQVGVGIVEDAGGDDSYEVTSVTRARAVARDNRTQVGQDFVPTIAEAATRAAGGSFVPASSQVVAEGVGISNGLGLVLDASGKDAYRVDLRLESIAEATGAHHLPARPDSDTTAGPTARALAPELDVYMQGVGQLGGLGAIEDGSGDDRYDVDMAIRADAAAADRRDPTSSNGYPIEATGTMSDGYHDIYSLGTGVIGGAGFIHDGLGNDAYEVTNALAASAVTTTERPDVAATSSAVSGEGSRAYGHGAGALGAYGELRDTAGTDRYACATSSTAEATSGDAFFGGGICQVLGGGAGAGFFSDLDGGASDVIMISPPFPATTGTRGQGVWAGPGGAGVNA